MLHNYGNFDWKVITFTAMLTTLKGVSAVILKDPSLEIRIKPLLPLLRDHAQYYDTAGDKQDQICHLRSQASV